MDCSKFNFEKIQQLEKGSLDIKEAEHFLKTGKGSKRSDPNSRQGSKSPS